MSFIKVYQSGSQIVIEDNFKGTTEKFERGDLEYIENSDGTIGLNHIGRNKRITVGFPSTTYQNQAGTPYADYAALSADWDSFFQPASTDDLKNILEDIAVISDNGINNPVLFDGSGRLKVSLPNTDGSYQFDNSLLPNIFESYIKGTGTFTQVNNGAQVATVATGDSVVISTRKRHLYKPGKPNVYQFTTIGFSPEVGIVKAVGGFSSNTATPYDLQYDGIRLETNDTEHQLIIENEQSAFTTIIPRSSWDDPLDGTGASGVNVDGVSLSFANFNIWEFDYLWLGGFNVRLYFFADGKKILCHTYKHSGTQNCTITRTPNFPLRFEIKAVTGAASNFSVICSKVAQEGNGFEVGEGATCTSPEINANATGNEYLLCAIRLTNRDKIFKILNFTTLATTNDNFILRFRINATLSGGTWDATGREFTEVIEQDGITVTGGQLIASFLAKANDKDSGLIEFIKNRIGCYLDGTFETIAFTVEPLTAGLDVYGSLNYLEIN